MNAPLPADAYKRPDKLYRYSQRQWLERSLISGEFRLRSPLEALELGAVTAPALAKSRPSPTLSYLTLSLSSVWDDQLFNLFSGSDACLIIHDPEQFGERVHRAAQRTLPSWAGIDAAVCYGKPSPLGAAFTKARQYATENEWLFAWRPVQSSLNPYTVVLNIGNIESIAEVRSRFRGN